MWKKDCTAGQATDDNMAHAHSILDNTNTQSQYVILIAFPLQQWLRERISMLRLYAHYLCFRSWICCYMNL